MITIIVWRRINGAGVDEQVVGFGRCCDSRVRLMVGVVRWLLKLDPSVCVVVSSLRWNHGWRSCGRRIVEGQRAVEKPGEPRPVVNYSTVLYRRDNSELIVLFRLWRKVLWW